MIYGSVTSVVVRLRVKVSKFGQTQSHIGSEREFDGL